MKNPLYLFLITVLSILVLNTYGKQALAEDFIAATVVSADLEKMEIIVTPLDSGRGRQGLQGKEHIIARVSEDNLVVNGMGKKVFPGCVSPGRIVRLWGRLDLKNKIFFVTDLRGWKGHGRHDPTGVRRRLQRGGAWNCPNCPGFHGGRR